MNDSVSPAGRASRNGIMVVLFLMLLLLGWYL